MMLRGFITVLVGCTPLIAWAQEDCKAITDDAKRLACFDQQFGVEKPPPKFQELRPVWVTRIKLRDEGTWDRLGKEPAAISASRVNGEDASRIKAGVVVLGPATEGGWQLFGGIGINRNTLTKDRADVRSITGGISGSIFNYYETGFSLWSTITLGARENKVDNAESSFARIDNYVAIRGLADGEEFAKGKNEFRLLPRFGVQLEDLHRVKQGSTPGNAQSVYLGLRYDYWPGAISDRVQLTAQTQRFRDTSVDTGMQRRTVSYHRLSADYHFYDQNDKTAWVTPILSLEREVGEDPLSGVPRVGRTQLSLKLKIN